MLLLLLACADKPDPVDTATSLTCAGPPELTVASPAEGATVAVGESVALSGSAVSSVGDTVVMLWAVSGDVEVVGATGNWVPTAGGDVIVTFQGEDRCGITQQDVHVHVEGADTGAG